MINSSNRLSFDSPEIRSPEKPIRSINRNAVYLAFGIALVAFSLVIYFMIKSRQADEEKPNQQTASRATNPLPVLDKMPDSYDQVAEKEYALVEQYPSEPPPPQPSPQQANPAYGHQAPSYGYAPEMRDDRSMREESDREAAERSSVTFASAETNSGERPTQAPIDARMHDSPSQNGMFFGKNSGEYTDKERFLQGGSSGAKHIRSAPSKYAVMQGTNFPGVLLTEINSDLPGPILAQITSNIFDSKTGRYLLIPQGSKLVGEYNSSVSHGQKRAQVAWTRLILPNTESVDLGRMPGVDAKGSAGIQGSVDNHYDDLLIGVLVTSLLSASAGISHGPVNPAVASPQQAIGQSVGQEVSRVGTKMAERSLGVQPTLKIASGSKINVFATDDVLLKPYVY